MPSVILAPRTSYDNKPQRISDKMSKRLLFSHVRVHCRLADKGSSSHCHNLHAGAIRQSNYYLEHQ